MGLASLSAPVTWSRCPLILIWSASGLAVATCAAALTLLSTRFGYEYDVEAMPVLWLVGGLVLAGLVFGFSLPQLIRRSAATDMRSDLPLVICIVAAGLVARLALFASEPMLEDDYHRYLWDGAVTASGYNPYAISPHEVQRLGGSDLGRLAQEGGLTVKRINHAELRTIYPPVAQAAFALAHFFEPWSLASWRSVLLAFDFAALALILLLLRETGRSPLWSALYWWNPVVIKELFNSAHMDAVVLPPLLLALLFAGRGRHILATASLALAAGAKIWPVLLSPLVIRPLTADPRRLVGALLVFCGLLALLLAPILLAGIDATSGYCAYADRWQTNSALFPTLEQSAAALLGPLGTPEASAGFTARILIALTLGLAAIALSMKPIEGTAELMGRASLLVAALVLLSPAQFPWYAVWYAPFLAFRPWAGMLLLAATMPLYYTFFHFAARDQVEIFHEVVVWIIWVPVWFALLIEAIRARTGARFV